MVSHQQAQLKDNQNYSIIHHLLYILRAAPETTTMAKLSTSCTSTNVFVLLSLAVCVMLATSAPTVRDRRSIRTLYYGITATVS